MEFLGIPLYPTVDVIGSPALALLFLFLLRVESRYGLRRRVQSRARRLLINGALVAIAALTLRLALVPAVVWTAHRAERAEFGLVRLLPLPPLLAGLLAFLLLDYTIYLWHRMTHRIPFLWRFHNVHHTDLDLDVSTALRFHFGEML
ncbi:MAG: sterol desaturase family protein, partial [Armatimonadetes bacterium]|nr:sterol desaturase family protein [Armatimonadota bacterium]